MQQILDSQTVKFLLIGLVVAVVLYVITFFALSKLGKNPKNVLPSNIAHRIKYPFGVLIIALFLKYAKNIEALEDIVDTYAVAKISTVMIIFAVTWILIIALKVGKSLILQNYDINTDDNFSARKVYTQFNVLENVVVFILITLAIGVTLMSFDNIRSIGVSMLTSAGIAGIIIGFAAQKALGTLLAGIQIAITQPIRIDDVVVVEGEWGRIEEINLTYVVVKIWDKRRLVLPTPYFIEQPFQNWTRNSSDILGTVFIYTDYNVPFDALRKELSRILQNTDLWDGEVNVLQVTSATAETVESRALMSAKDSPTAWDLRVLVREKLISYIQKNYPASLPRTRVEMLAVDDTPLEKTESKGPEESKLLEKDE